MLTCVAGKEEKGAVALGKGGLKMGQLTLAWGQQGWNFVERASIPSKRVIFTF